MRKNLVERRKHENITEPKMRAYVNGWNAGANDAKNAILSVVQHFLYHTQDYQPPYGHNLEEILEAHKTKHNL